MFFRGRDCRAYGFRFRRARSKRSGADSAEASVADIADIAGESARRRVRRAAGPRSVIAETVPELPCGGSREESLIVVELSFVAQQAIETGGDAALVMGFIDEQVIDQLADPIGGRFELLESATWPSPPGIESNSTRPQ